MRLVFAGTPEFAARALGALQAAGHQIALVVTQPDRPAGRGLRPAASPVKQRAHSLSLPVFQPHTLKDGAALERIGQARPEALVVAAYGLILPAAVLALPPYGAINIHASLLPRWRGAAPIQRALLAGDTETGITIMQMDEGLDTGPMLSVHRLGIEPQDDAQTLHDRLAELGAEAIVHALADLQAGRLKPNPQPEAGACYAHKLSKSEAQLDWTRPSVELERAVRALRPSPGARAGRLKIWGARLASGSGAPGSVLSAGADGIVVGCGSGALCVTELQRPGGARLGAAEFLRGFALRPGERFGSAG